MKKYQATGGADIIGLQIVQTPLDQNATIRVLDNFSSINNRNIAELNISKNDGQHEIGYKAQTDLANGIKRLRIG